jgi:hypothetical protein
MDSAVCPRISPTAAARVSSQSPKKVARLHYADFPEGFQSSQMAVAGNDQVSPAGDGALQDPVIGWVFGNHLQGG